MSESIQIYWTLRSSIYQLIRALNFTIHLETIMENNTYSENLK